MLNNLDQDHYAQRVVQFFSLCLVVFGFVIIGSVVFLQCISWFTGTDLKAGGSLFASLENNPRAHFYVCFAQLCTALVSFILLPFLYIRFFRPDILTIIFNRTSTAPISFIIVVMISLAAFPLISFLAYWNKNLLQLSGSLEQFTQWMSKAEEEAKLLTEWIVFYESPLDFMLVLSVIAIFPAIGEEFLFRGIIQNQLNIIFRNPHWAIWITGFLFSFIHFQFFGFIPRMILGVLFGYVYYWTNNLWLPILMHFINNATTLIVANWQISNGKEDVLENEADFPITITIASMFLIGYFLRALYQKRAVKNDSKIYF